MTALQSHDGFDRWHNAVPAWVREHPGVQDPPKGRKLSAAGVTRFMQVVANEGHADDHGNIVGIWGNSKLRRRFCRSRSQWFIYVAYAHELGILVTLARGGVLGAGQDAVGKRSIANTYGIPAQPGSLDRQRVERRVQAMRPTGEQTDAGRPVLAPTVEQAGAQTTLYNESPLKPYETGLISQATPTDHRPAPFEAQSAKPSVAPQASDPHHAQPHAEPGESHARPINRASCPGQNTAVHGPADYPRPLSGLPPSAQRAQPLPIPSPGYINHGGNMRRPVRSKPRSSAKTGQLPKLTPRDLTDIGRLLELLPKYQAAWPAAFHGVADPELYLVAMGRYAMATKTKTPAALFVSNVRAGRWLFITEAAEQDAQRELVSYRRRSTSEAPAYSAPTTATPDPPAMTDTGRKVLASLKASGCKPGGELRGWAVARSQFGMQRDEFNRGISELITLGKWRAIN